MPRVSPSGILSLYSEQYDLIPYRIDNSFSPFCQFSSLLVLSFAVELPSASSQNIHATLNYLLVKLLISRLVVIVAVKVIIMAGDILHSLWVASP